MRLKLFCIKPRIFVVVATIVGLLLSACASTTQPALEKQKSELKQTPQFECIAINDQIKRQREISRRVTKLPTIRKLTGSKTKFTVEGQLNKHCELLELTMVRSTGNYEADASILKELREVRVPTRDANKEIDTFKLVFIEDPFN
jgi:hypothetical protein